MLKKFLPLLLIICMALTACSDNSPDTGSGTGEVVERKAGGVLRMGCVPVDTLNPLLTSHASILDALSLVYEGLFVTLPDLSVEPVLATEYIASENNTVYTIKLRDSVNFHNGKRFTSADVVATLSYMAIYGGNFSDVMSEIEAYYADGADTVVIRLKRSISDFVNNLDFPVLPEGLADAHFLPGNKDFVPNGTGPYRYSGSVEHKKLYLEANKKWHSGEKSAYIEKVEISVLTDEKTIISAFDVGAIDVLSTSWENIADMNLTSSMYNVFECEQNRYTFIGINCNCAAFDTASERRKIASAINAESVAADIMIGNAVAATSPMRESVYFNGDTNVRQEKWHERRENSEGDEAVKFTLLYNSGSKTKSRLASAIRQQLEAHGYEVTLNEQPFEVYSERVMLDGYDLYIGEVNFNNCADLSFMFGNAPGSMRMCNYFDSEFTNLVSNLNLMNGKEDKTIAWNNFENYFVRNAIQIPLYFTNGALLVNKRISGTPKPNISNLYYGIAEMYIENDE